MASPKRLWLYEELLDHSIKCHNGEERFIIWRISNEEYRAFLKASKNPEFWKAFNNIRKLKS